MRPFPWLDAVLLSIVLGGVAAIAVLVDAPFVDGLLVSVGFLISTFYHLYADARP